MTSANREAARIVDHLSRAERAARRSDLVRALRERPRRLVRALLLDALADYRCRGRFPRNDHHRDRPMPYFVDARGTRCAMAHLMELGGATGLVAEIARHRNNAFVRELADDPRLLAWLAAAGVSVEEAALIQPSYCEPRGARICGGGFEADLRANATGVLEVTVTAQPSPSYVTATIDAVYGNTNGRAVGGSVTIWPQPIGAKLLVPLGEFDAGADDAGVPLEGADGLVLTNGVLGTLDHPLAKRDVIDALQLPSSDCQQRTAAIDAYWGASSCDDGPTGGACSTAAETSSSPATIEILLAVVGALVLRRSLR